MTLYLHLHFYCIQCLTFRVSGSLQTCHGDSISEYKSHIAFSRLEGTAAITNLLGYFSVILFQLCLCIPERIYSSAFMWTTSNSFHKTFVMPVRFLHISVVLWCGARELSSRAHQLRGERIETSGGGLEADCDKQLRLAEHQASHHVVTQCDSHHLRRLEVPSTSTRRVCLVGLDKKFRNILCCYSNTKERLHVLCAILFFC